MKHNKVLLLAAAVLMLGTAVAAPVNPKRAAALAQSFFSSQTGAKSGNLLATVPIEWQYDGIYLFEGANGGFVLVAADDVARPILGYSATGTIDTANMPPALQEWLQGYQKEIDILREAKGFPPHAEWYALEQGITPKDTVWEGVEPMLTTFWDQGYPYNGYCPGGSVTGCAATAQAQVMNYWKYPAFGQGSHSYTHVRYGVQQADFGHTLYDWENMPVAATASSPMVEKEAVALLMYHCGVSLEMDYSRDGSAAAGLAGISGYASIDNSLKDYFGYSNQMRVVHKDFGYGNAEWRDMIIADLDLGHPIVYTGAAEEGGHGFVCDGYDSRGYMHFNFGWSGRGDGYFPVDSISPGVGGVGGNVTYTFNMSNSALLGLVPDYRLRVSDTLFSMNRDGGADSLLFAPNSAVNTVWSMVCDADWLTVQVDTFAHACRVRFIVPENNTGEERVATITFAQGGERCLVRVVQSAYNEEELCPVTVVMECTHGETWQGGAYLSLQSASGYIYGTARLEQGTMDSVDIAVAPHDVYAVWHKGGGTDRYVNYTIKNRYEEALVSVKNAYRNGGSHFIEWPCAHLDIEEVPSEGVVNVYPNPVTDVLNIQADNVQKVELMDMSGRRILTTDKEQIDVRRLHAGAYFVRVITSRNTTIKRVVKK
ncbi:MAG: C10 family peptidase [Bacteroidales bacterium]|nr:C10 family peptidase [Bacteroidales bacterium]